jgi:quercetin dioxygenase-like cupin family protein
MALRHTPSSEVVRIVPLGAALKGSVNTAILKAKELEVIRLVVPEGKTLPQHQVPGEITLLCIEGECELQTPGAVQVLGAGDFVHLEGATPHALTGRSDASLLLTISLCTQRLL